MNKNTTLLIIIILFSSSLAWAQNSVLSLKEVWSEISKSSLSSQASQAQIEATKVGLSKARNHWLPKAYINARSSYTNDPGVSFFGVMQQRALQTANLAVDKINNPEADLYTQGSLGLDLPLYEGGVRAAQIDMMKAFVKSGEKQGLQTEIEQFSLVSKYYGFIQNILLKKNQLKDLRLAIQKQLKTYQLGAKSNPVGYSGLLGMKSLLNRIQGLINQYEGQSQGYKKVLNEMGLKSIDWTTERLPTEKYIESLNLRNESVSKGSYKVESLSLNANALSLSPKMELARSLPQVGAFAEGYVFNGSHDTANGYTLGLYLKWSLFDPSTHGSVKEARLKALAMSKSSDALAQQEQAEKWALLENLKALKKNHSLMLASEKLLNEQTKTSQILFQNGSINALQMTEVLNRRVDLLTQISDIESAMIDISTNLIKKTKYTNAKFELY